MRSSFRLVLLDGHALRLSRHYALVGSSKSFTVVTSVCLPSSQGRTRPVIRYDPLLFSGNRHNYSRSRGRISIEWLKQTLLYLHEIMRPLCLLLLERP